MAKKTIYVVMGTTGEYSDRTEWPIAAYSDKAMAQEHVTKATEMSRAVAAAVQQLKDDWNGEGEYPSTLGRNPYDPDQETDYTGTDYFIYRVRLRRELPKAN